MQKKQLIDSVDQVRALKGIRNGIAHKYKLEDQRSIFKEVLTETVISIELSNKVLRALRY